MCQPYKTLIGLLAIAFASAAVAAPPPGAAPLIGDFAYDRQLHDGTAADVDPLPIERSADFDWMVHDTAPHWGRSLRADTLAARIGRSAPARLAHRLGADEVIVPVMTLRL